VLSFYGGHNDTHWTPAPALMQARLKPAILALAVLVLFPGCGTDAQQGTGSISGFYVDDAVADDGTPADARHRNELVLTQHGDNVYGSLVLNVRIGNQRLSTAMDLSGTYDHPNLALRETGTATASPAFTGTVSAERDTITLRFDDDELVFARVRR
jgi:hypothetical protein